MEKISPEILKQYDFFSGFTVGALEELSSKFKIVNFPADTELVKYGIVGESFYFLKQGQIEVVRKTAKGKDEKVSVFGSGEGLKGMPLLTCSVRSISLKTVTEVVLYELLKSDFENIVLEESSYKNMLHNSSDDYSQFNAIKNLKPFANLAPDKMYAVMEKMIEKKYAPGDNIITQGEKGDFYYVIKSGRVSVLKKKKGEEEAIQVAELGVGDAFGEEALIRDDPRNATCQAIEETLVYALNKKDFAQIMQSSFLENIFPEDISVDTYLDEYIVIDARIPAEYKEEHIYGAVNIPVEILRQQCTGFDKSKQYITYCLNDSRGMVAAFLLKLRGFNAQCLRGGVSGWMGEVVTGADGIYLPNI
jgi:CRP-like cAMP-binding protein/rhodanese-related sulfurtransferase